MISLAFFFLLSEVLLPQVNINLPSSRFSAVQDTTHQIKSGKPYEISFSSSFQYGMQYSEVAELQLSIRFEHEDGSSITIMGFWDGMVDGKSVWKARFHPPKAGSWHWKSTFSTNDPEIHGLEGSFKANHTHSLNANFFDTKGWLEVAPSGRHLMHSNGEPFFWQGDTAWEISWKSTKEEVDQYLDNREAKGFNSIYIVIHSHQYLYPNFVTNRYGISAYLNNNYSDIHPAYFEHVDYIISEANKKDMLVGIVTLWATMTEVHHEGQPHERFLSKKQSLQLARYVGARYAGHNVFWIVGGDQPYVTSEQKDFWEEFAQVQAASSGPQHLRTIHPSGYEASFSFFDFQTPWIDFHIYHSSHLPASGAAWFLAAEGYKQQPPKPVLNIEPNYEHIPSFFWEQKPEYDRITDANVRHTAYESLLWGALMGVSYGANGVWQWSTPSNPGSHLPLELSDALQLPGSDQMVVMRKIFEHVEWYNLEPIPHRISETDSPLTIPLATIANTVYYAYIPEGTSFFSIDFPEDTNEEQQFEMVWISPVNGDTVSSAHHRLQSSYTLAFRTPNTSKDWIWKLTAKHNQTEPPESHTPEGIQLNTYPNPFNKQSTIVFALNTASPVRIDVFSILGEHVYEVVNRNYTEGFHEVVLNGTSFAQGVYLLRLETNSGSIARKITVIR